MASVCKQSFNQLRICLSIFHCLNCLEMLMQYQMDSSSSNAENTCCIMFDNLAVSILIPEKSLLNFILTLLEYFITYL